MMRRWVIHDSAGHGECYAADGRRLLARIAREGSGYRGYLISPGYDASEHWLPTDTVPTLVDAYKATEELLMALEPRQAWDLPRTEDLAGSDPDFTGQLSSEEFMRRTRGAE